MRKSVILIMSLIVACVFLAKAQEENPIRLDQEFWMRYGVEKEINNRSDISVQWSRRFDEKRSLVKNTFLEISSGFKLNKYLKLGIKARRIDRKGDKESSDRITFMGRAKYRFMDKLDLSTRLQFERQWEREEDTRDRYRAKVSAKMTRIKEYPRPLVSLEYFFREQGGFSGWSKERWKFGFDQRFLKRHELTLCFVIQEDLNIRKPQRDEVWSIDYMLSF